MKMSTKVKLMNMMMKCAKQITEFIHGETFNRQTILKCSNWTPEPRFQAMNRNYLKLTIFLQQFYVQDMHKQNGYQKQNSAPIVDIKKNLMMTY